ncbi:MAG: ParB N-terminal domain-containing protein [Anaerolineae bacterium]
MDAALMAPSDLRIADSRYAFAPPAAGGADDAQLRESVQQLGIVTPLVAHPVDGALHLVDGFRRAAAVAPRAGANVPVVELPQDTELRHVLALQLTSCSALQVESLAAKAALVRHARELGLSADESVEWLLPALGLERHRRVLVQLEKVANLPPAVLAFAARKGFSLKQCRYLAHHGSELLGEVFAWAEHIHLTAGIAAELLENAHDWLRANDADLEQLIAALEPHEHFAASASPHERTTSLRRALRVMRFPHLSEVSQRMQSVRAGLQLPPAVQLSWDSTLEHHEVQLAVRITKAEQWPPIAQRLVAEDVAQGLLALLEEL